MVVPAQCQCQCRIAPNDAARNLPMPHRYRNVELLRAPRACRQSGRGYQDSEGTCSHNAAKAEAWMTPRSFNESILTCAATSDVVALRVAHTKSPSVMMSDIFAR